MLPISLDLSNFMIHCSSHIDFEKLGSVIFIIGSKDDSTRRSNAVGKSTIFHAIRYALFNVGVDKKISKIIHRGASKAEVTFVFQMSDGNIYKIYRYRTDTTTGVTLHRKNGNDWDKLSGRRSSDTDEAIEKIIGINLTTFENTSYFKQEDIMNLAKATPEKRKEIISSMLELSKWSEYKEFAKDKRKQLGIELSTIERQLVDLGNPKETIFALETELGELTTERNEETANLEKLQKIQDADVEKGNSIVALYKDKKQIEQKYSDAVLFLQETKDNLKFIETSIGVSKKQIEDYENESIECKKSIENKNTQLANSLSEMPEAVDMAAYEAEKNELAKHVIELRENKALLKNFQAPLPKGVVCPSCSTELNEQKRKELINDKQIKIEQLENGISNLEDVISICQENIQQFDGAILKYNTLKSFHMRLTSDIGDLAKKINNNSTLIETYQKRINDLENKKAAAIEAIEKAEKSYEDVKIVKVAVMNNQYGEEIQKLKAIVNNRATEIKSLATVIQQNTLSIGAITERIKQNNININKFDESKQKQLELSEEIKLYDAVIHAFSNKGIPFMIINSVLGAIQDETNKLLQLLRNNMLTQFVLDKQKDNELQETLDMKFYTGQDEWEYGDLSGGQKGSVALALKVAMAVISRKRCGADIKMLLLDEVDQPLDDESVESFYEILKTWSKDMVIMVITHRSELKSKLNNYIMVTDKNGYISAKAVKDE